MLEDCSLVPALHCQNEHHSKNFQEVLPKAQGKRQARSLHGSAQYSKYRRRQHPSPLLTTWFPPNRCNIYDSPLQGQMLKIAQLHIFSLLPPELASKSNLPLKMLPGFRGYCITTWWVTEIWPATSTLQYVNFKTSPLMALMAQVLSR